MSLKCGVTWAENAKVSEVKVVFYYKMISAYLYWKIDVMMMMMMTMTQHKKTKQNQQRKIMQIRTNCHKIGSMWHEEIH